jgi:hypothetical protein
MIGFLYESFWVIQEEDDERDFSGFLCVTAEGQKRKRRRVSICVSERFPGIV